MSNENIVCSHQLVIRFEQDADNMISWSVQADAAIENTMQASLDELANAGAPLAGRERALSASAAACLRIGARFRPVCRPRALRRQRRAGQRRRRQRN